MSLSNTNTMMEARLYALQRISAVVMAPLVIIHLVTIMLAVQNGLSAEEILSRTQGASIWAWFYIIFVIAVAIHAPLGLRKIIKEWLGLADQWANRIAFLIFIILFALGMRAVVAVI